MNYQNSLPQWRTRPLGNIPINGGVSYQKITPAKKVSKELLPMQTSDLKFKLVLGSKVLNKISILCEKIPNREWSGIIFYTHEGDVDDIENLVITAIDLYPLDIGTATYTEFEYTPDFAGYIGSNLELMDASMGLIHSHQNMSVFFSGTDEATLREQAPIYKTFLSVIVNNKLDVEAAMSIESSIDTSMDIKYQSLDKRQVVRQSTKSTTNIIRYNCHIKKEYDTDADFLNIVEELLQKPSNHSNTIPLSPVNTANTTTNIQYLNTVTTTPNKEIVRDAKGLFENEHIEKFLIDCILMTYKSCGHQVAVTNNTSLESAIKLISNKLLDFKTFSDTIESIIRDSIIDYSENKWDETVLETFVNEVLSFLEDKLDVDNNLMDNERFIKIIEVFEDIWAECATEFDGDIDSYSDAYPYEIIN